MRVIERSDVESVTVKPRLFRENSVCSGTAFKNFESTVKLQSNKMIVLGRSGIPIP